MGEDGVRCVPWPNGEGGDIWAVQELARRVQWGIGCTRGNLCSSYTHRFRLQALQSDGTCWRVQVGRASVIRNPACLPRTPVSSVPFSEAQDQGSAGTGALPGSGLCLASWRACVLSCA